MNDLNKTRKFDLRIKNIGSGAAEDADVVPYLNGVAGICVEVVICEHETCQLNVRSYPEDITDYIEVKWSTDDVKIADVDSKGYVTGKSHGVTNITVQTLDGSYEAKCIIKVEPFSSDTTFVSN